MNYFNVSYTGGDDATDAYHESYAQIMCSTGYHRSHERLAYCYWKVWNDTLAECIGKLILSESFSEEKCSFSGYLLANASR